MYACAITGHRPTRFRFKYNENDSRCKRLKKQLREQFALLYSKGVRRFYVGGALGVDQWIELIVVQPFPDHDACWDDRSRERLAFLIRHSTEHIVIGEEARRENFIKRNRYMVDHADCLLAVYDNSRSIRSGTGATVHYAEKTAKPIIFIHPDTMAVTTQE